MKSSRIKFTHRVICIFSVAVFHSGDLANAELVSWFSASGKTNLDSSGVQMTSGFQFQLGVFSGGFTPTAANFEQWPSHWVPAATSNYDAVNKQFGGQFSVTNNNSPFLVGASAWIYGFRITPTGTDRLLFRKLTWTWPAPNPMNPLGPEWNASDADQVILGSIHASGTPWLMKASLGQTFTQWQVDQLTGVSLNGPTDDPDQDGVSNLLEFVFGTNPNIPGSPTAMPLSLVSDRLQISIPRRIDHPASLVVEVSGDLVQWQSGPLHTEVVSDGGAALVVRDLTPLGPLHPRRFIRLKAALGSP